MIEPLWTLILDQSHQVMGGALVAGRLYVTTQEGQLYAIGEAEPLPTVLPIAQATQVTPQEAAGEDDRVVDFTAEPALAQVTSVTPEEKTDVETGSLLDLAGEPIGPQDPQLEIFFEDEASFSGKPVVGEDGTVYIGSKSGKLYALEPSGEILWEVTLPEKPVGAPALDVDGNLYVVDEEGGLSTLTPGGEILWRFQTEEGSALSGPVISPDGVLFYLVGTYSKGFIQAVSASGKGLWLTELQEQLLKHMLDISPAGDFVFYHDEVFDASDGSRMEFDLSFAVDKFFGGEDGKTYLWAGGTVVEWRYIDSKFEMTEERVLSSIEYPGGVGVTPEGVVWLEGGNAVFWFTKDGKALAAVDFSEVSWESYQSFWFGSLFPSIDRDYTVYACGSYNYVDYNSCWAFSPRSIEPLWEVDLEEWGMFEYAEKTLGGALAPGRLYISSSKGYLYLIRDEEN
jgi:outer membrane protein assembly factor BamB